MLVAEPIKTAHVIVSSSAAEAATPSEFVPSIN